ncbi:MAG TPA: molybdopterin-dependent oxidoreductase [Thermoanaerobaculia bacterium]|nr:molybdopterin-dependent oxidoreductase [Thermoanaerobaculia bacterium]
MDEKRPLPPGQTETRKFPVVGEREPAPGALELGRWRLVVDGLVERRLELAWSEWLALPRSERTTDIHCVTGWSRLGVRQAGVPLDVLLERARPLDGARFVRFEAASLRAHDTSLPLELARAETWLVDTIDGRPLEPEHGAPLRTVTPSRYFYKSLKWLRRIELLAEDRLGYWERESAYHNDADPWPGNQRFTTGSLDPRELDRLRDARDLGPWRSPKKVLLGVDLAGWEPAADDLSGLRIKASDLRGARLAGRSLERVNFSLSDLRDADLAGARLAGADLEGANLAGADLSDADLTGCALSATRFCDVDAAGRERGARVEGLRLDGASGLLEDQERWLRAHGVRLPEGTG